MKKSPYCPQAPHKLRSHLSTAALLFGGAVVMAGCSSQPPRSLGTLPAIESSTLSKVSENLAQESAKLNAVQDETRKSIEKRTPAPVLEPIAPKHDPLEDIVVSINLSNASLSDVLQVLAEQANVSMVVDPEVLALDKHASLYLKRVSARQLYLNVLDAFDLTGKVEGNTIKIGLYEQRLFNLDFLNTRMDMNINAGGNVFGSMSSGGGGGGGGGGGSSGSSGSSGGGGSGLISGNVSVTGGSAKQIEPYNEIESNLKRILGTKEGKGEKRQDNPAGLSASGVAPVQSNIENDRRELGAVYSLNRSSGTLYVSARPSQMQMVEKLIGRYSKVMRRQVLIEAQLLDVELNDNFQFGVDWDLLRNHLTGVVGGNPITAALTGAPTLPGVDASLPPRSLVFPQRSVGLPGSRSGGLMYSDNAVSVALSMLRNFGNVKVLSNPNIRVRNNTPALLSVGTSIRYVSKVSSTTSNPGGGASTITADVQTDAVFDGVVIGVMPFIGEHGEIDLMIHPMQTEVDPTSLVKEDVGGNSKVSLPKIKYKGMTTTLNIKDGDTVIIGGLIDQSTSNRDTGLPGLSDTPVLGRLFGAEASAHKSRELVMVLRVKEL